MKPLILWLIVICALTLAVATCGDDDDDDDSSDAKDDDAGDDDTVDDDTDDDADDDIDDDGADDDTQAECDTWTDAASGLTWLVDPLPFQSGWAFWPDAVEACEILECG